MSNVDWLPGKPEKSGGGDYFRLKDLKKYPDRMVDVRILEPFMHGWEVWCSDGKPYRSAEKSGLPASDKWRVEDGERDEPKQFWATLLYNHSNKKFQVFSFNQGTVYNQLDALKKKWGQFDAYDITLGSTGEGLETKYTVMPNSKEPAPAGVLADWARIKESWTGLAALYSGGHPLATFDTAVKVDADIPF